MPIRVTEHVPPPAPQPPSTYGIDGLDKQEMGWLAKNLQYGMDHQRELYSWVLLDEEASMLRVIQAITAKGF